MGIYKKVGVFTFILFLNLFIISAWGFTGDDISITTYDTNITHLDNITDVNAGSPSDEDFLRWNSGTSRWINEAVAGFSDTNETTRINNALGNCSANEVVFGFDNNLNKYCVVDQTGAGGTGKSGDGIYLYNDSDTMYFNETRLNLTIISKANETGYLIDWNSSGFIINWSSSGEPLWNANYSTFLTHITWANAVNGTLATWSNVVNGTMLQTSQQTNLSEADVDGYCSDNGYFVNISNFTGTITDTKYCTYDASIGAINCTSDGGSGITWANAVNGTLFTQSEWDTNYTANNANWLSDADTFAGSNYSTFLTHITWANAVNGTLALVSQLVSQVGNWSADKSDYFTSAEVLGFSYYNSTDFSIADYYLKSNPFSYYNSTNPSPDTDSNLTEDDVEAYIFDTDNTANLQLEQYNITNISYSTFCNGANCWKIYVNASDYFIIEEL